MAILTVASKVFGFFREASLAAVFGATAETDAFLVAQSIPLLLFSALSYALTTTFIPLYSDIKERRGPEESLRFAAHVLTMVILAGCVLVIAGEIVAESLAKVVAPGFQEERLNLTTYLTRLIFPMMIFQLMSGVLAGLLQAHGEFSVPTSAALVQSGATIAFTLALGPRHGIAAAALGVLVGAAGATAINLLAALRIGFRLGLALDFTIPEVRHMARLIIPAIIGASAGEINTLVDRVLASTLPEGRIAALNYANRLAELAPSVVGLSIMTVVYPTLAKLAARKDWRAFSGGLVDSLALMHFLMVPIAAGVVVLREPLVRIVFQRGVFDDAATAETAWALLFFGFGIAIFSMRRLVNRAFFSLKDTRTPMLITFGMVALNVVLNITLISPLQQGGLALGTTLSSLAGLVAGLVLIRRKMPTGVPIGRLLSSCSRSTLSSLLMGVIVYCTQKPIFAATNLGGTFGEALGLLVSACVGAIAYGAFAWVLRIRELYVLVSVIRKFMVKLVPKFQA